MPSRTSRRRMNPSFSRCCDRRFDQLGIGRVPRGVAAETEAFGHQQRAPRRRHRRAPVGRLVQPAERNVLAGKIDPGLVGRPLALEHHRHDDEIAVAQPRRRRTHLGRRVRGQCLNNLGQRNSGQKCLARKLVPPSPLPHADTLNAPAVVVYVHHPGVGGNRARALDLIAQALGDAADPEPRVQKPIHERRQRGAALQKRAADGGAQRQALDALRHPLGADVAAADAPDLFAVVAEIKLEQRPARTGPRPSLPATPAARAAAAAPRSPRHTQAVSPRWCAGRAQTARSGAGADTRSICRAGRCGWCAAP